MNNYTIYKYSVDSVHYYLYFNAFEHWMISNDAISTDNATITGYLCEKSNLLDCTAGNWFDLEVDELPSSTNDATIKGCMYGSSSPASHGNSMDLVEIEIIEIVSIIAGLLLLIICIVLCMYYSVKQAHKILQLEMEHSVQYGTLAH